MTPIGEKIYFNFPIFLQNALVSSYGLALFWRRFAGREHFATLRLLRRIERFSRQEIDQYQAQQLRNLLDAASRTRYYSELFRQYAVSWRNLKNVDDLRQLPTLHKTQLRKKPLDFVVDGAKDRSLVINTSGTTGTPLSIYCNRQAMQRNYAHLYRLREWMGVRRWQSCATFAGRTVVPPGATSPPFWRYNLATNSTLFSTYHISKTTLPDYVNKLERLQPELIDSYPSAIWLIARYLAENGITSIRPKAIMTSSETLLQHQRQAVEESFGCQVYDQYGGAEMVAFIAQCRYGSYHIWPTYGICEVLVGDRPAEPGERGELVCTGLINDVMPLIRYRTGDAAIRGNDNCGCKLAYPTIHELEGRMDDLILASDGRQVGRLDPVFKGVQTGALNEAQLVQTELGSVTLRYVKGQAFSGSTLGTIEHALKDRLGPTMAVKFDEVTEIPRNQAGKFRSVVSTVTKRS